MTTSKPAGKPVLKPRVIKKTGKTSVLPVSSAKTSGKGLGLDLALQGGGAHGAFTWGVLDRLLDEKDIDIQGISGTSAGALNGAMLVYGMLKGGRSGAKKLLAEFWDAVADIGAIYSPIKRLTNSLDQMWKLPGFDPFPALHQDVSPYQSNPFNLNPLRDLLVRLLDIEAIQNSDHMRLFVTATNVETGQGRVFHCKDLTIEALLASACLPLVYQAVEIEGVPYWDGGYVGNPVIWPLIYNTEASDVLLVQINPLIRKGTPTTLEEIVNRMNEITFNSSLVAEMRAIRFVTRLLEEQKIDPRSYKKVLMHRLSMQDTVTDVTASSKDNTNRDFLQMLHQKGKEAASHWLKAHKADIGVRESIDINEAFLKPKNGKKK